MDIASLYRRAFPSAAGRIAAPLGLAAVAVAVAPGLAAIHRHAAYWARVARHAAAAGHPVVVASPAAAYLFDALPAVAAMIVVIYACSRSGAAGRHLIRASILPAGEDLAGGDPRPSAFSRAYPTRRRQIAAVAWTGLVLADTAAGIHAVSAAGGGTHLMIAQSAIIWVAGLIICAAGWHPVGEPGAEPRRSWLRVREDRQ